MQEEGIMSFRYILFLLKFVEITFLKIMRPDRQVWWGAGCLGAPVKRWATPPKISWRVSSMVPGTVSTEKLIIFPSSPEGWKMKRMGLSALKLQKKKVGFMKVGTKYFYSWQPKSMKLIVMLTNILWIKKWINVSLWRCISPRGHCVVCQKKA